MYLVVGLGNPGKEYDLTYHNVGFMVLDKMAEKLGLTFSKKKMDSYFAEGFLNNQKIMLIKPTTYMNLSGNSVVQFVRKFKLQSSDITVVCDDIDLPKGKVRFRLNGSGGTHNGLKSIVFSLNSTNFKRVKIGIGREQNVDLKDYVLSKIDDESLKIIYQSIDEAIEKILDNINLKN